ncbi:MAG: precorrin-4 C(11)-methyltransferase [Desulfatibacillaceae bacterium]
MKKHPVRFVGAGPGDPELITVKGQRALAEADLVVYAGSLVPEAVVQWAGNARHENSAGMHLGDIVDVMARAHEAGEKVVRLHSGDPSLYGAIAEQMVELEIGGIPYEVVPGITAAFAAAAALTLEYTLPEVCQTIILTRMEGRTPVPELENLESLAAHQASMAVYLSSGLADRVQPVLVRAYGADAPVVVAYRVSQPDQRLVWTTAAELAQTMETEGIDRQALIIAGRVLAERQKDFARSKLYDRTFSHGYRAGEDY